MRHFVSAGELTRAGALYLFAVAADVKQRWKAGRRGAPLAGRSLALIFEKPSLRTRVTFEVGAHQLGARGVYLSGPEIGLGTRESVPDVARNLSRWVDGIVARVHDHATVETLARHATVPVINALSDLEHPCQALADYFTLWERGLDLAKLRLAFVGDGNNMCHSLVLLGSVLGTSVVVACPPGYEPSASVLERARQAGGRVDVTEDARAAVTGADVVYTDVWVSMGQERERERRLEAFGRYQVSETLLGFARPSAVFMHCLPAHRGEEVADGVIDGPRSIVLDQAENRLHAQKAVILDLLGGVVDDDA